MCIWKNCWSVLFKILDQTKIIIFQSDPIISHICFRVYIRYPLCHYISSIWHTGLKIECLKTQRKKIANPECLKDLWWNWYGWIMGWSWAKNSYDWHVNGILMVDLWFLENVLWILNIRWFIRRSSIFIKNFWDFCYLLCIFGNIQYSVVFS